MSEINLLPVDSRGKDIEEDKKRKMHQRKDVVELTNPQIKKKQADKSGGNFWGDVKHEFKEMFGKKKKKDSKQDSKKLADKKEARKITDIHQKKVHEEEKKKIELKPLMLMENEKQKDFKKESKNEDEIKAKNEFFNKDDIADIEETLKPLDNEMKKVKQDKNNEEKSDKIDKETQEKEEKNIAQETKEEQKIKLTQLNGDEIKNKKEEKDDKPEEPKIQKQKEKKELFKKKTVKIPVKDEINLVPSDIKSQRSLLSKIKIGVIIILLILIVAMLFSIMVSRSVATKEAKVKRLEKQIEQTASEIKNLERQNVEVDDFITLLGKAKEITEEHVFPKNIFDFLEENTLQDTYYEWASFSAETQVLTLSGVSKDYRAMAEQLLYLQSLDDIESIEVGEVGLAEEVIRDEEGEIIETNTSVEYEIKLKLKDDVLFEKNIKSEE